MYKYIIYLFLMTTTVANGQALNRLTIGYQGNVDLLRFNKAGRAYNNANNNMHSYTQTVSFNYSHLFKNRKWVINGGASYRNTQLKVEDYFVYAPLIDDSDGSIYYEKKGGVYQSKTFQFGFNLEVERIIHQQRIIHGHVGLATQHYFYSKYNDGVDFIHSNELAAGIDDYNQNNAYSKADEFSFIYTSASIEAYYKLGLTGLNTSIPFDFSLKASLGTNIYSIINQSKQNIWIGLGAEIGLRMRRKVK